MSKWHRRAGVTRSGVAVLLVTIGILSVWAYHEYRTYQARVMVADSAAVSLKQVRTYPGPNRYEIVRDGQRVAYVELAQNMIWHVSFKLPYPKGMNWAEATPEEQTEAIKNEIGHFFSEHPGALTYAGKGETARLRVYCSSESRYDYEVNINPKWGILWITRQSRSDNPITPADGAL